MRLLQAVRNQTARIAAHIEDSKLFNQRGDVGTFREQIVANFLRPFLPECYGLSSGEVFADDGSQSAQVDIVIYDAVFSTVLFRDGPTMLFPAESVFGSIEVKSNLSSSELSKAIENIASVKRLPRADTDMMDFSPTVRLNVGPVFSYDRTKRNPYLGVIFGYNGIAAELAGQQLNQRLLENPADKELLADFVFVAKPAYLIARAEESGGRVTLKGPGQDFKTYAFLKTEDALPLFYLALNLCLGNLRLRSIDFGKIWERLFLDVMTQSRTK